MIGSDTPIVQQGTPCSIHPYYSTGESIYGYTTALQICLDWVIDMDLVEVLRW